MTWLHVAKTNSSISLFRSRQTRGKGRTAGEWRHGDAAEVVEVELREAVGVLGYSCGDGSEDYTEYVWRASVSVSCS